MSAIQDYMSSDHAACDDLFVRVESMAGSGRWDEADVAWREFETALRRHFAMEEEVLFPAFEEATGMTGGPTEVMRLDHDQMRAMLTPLEVALRARDAAGFLGHSAAMLVLIQQHNMKEEHVLYPMADQHLRNAAGTIDAMQRVGEG